MNIIDITDLGPEIAAIELFSLMTHPADAEKRSRLRSWHLARLAVALKYTPLPAEVMEDLIKAGDSGVGDQIGAATAGGCMAGDVLLILLEMARSGVDNPGLDRAQHVVSEIYTGAINGEGKSIKAGRDTVRNNWKAYRTVAHLWAAFVVMLRDAEDIDLRNSPDKWLDGLRLGSIANEIYTMAGETDLPRSDDPILPNAWEIRGAQPISLTVPKLSESVEAALKRFTPRFRQ